MRFISKHRITHIIIMRNLYFIEQNYILKLCRITDYRTLSYDGIATDKCTVSYFCILADDCRAMNVSRRKYVCRLGNPQILFHLIILLFGKCLSKLHNKISDFRKHFPRVSYTIKNIFRNCFI